MIFYAYVVGSDDSICSAWQHDTRALKPGAVLEEAVRSPEWEQNFPDIGMPYLYATFSRTNGGNAYVIMDCHDDDGNEVVLSGNWLLLRPEPDSMLRSFHKQHSIQYPALIMGPKSFGVHQCPDEYEASLEILSHIAAAFFTVFFTASRPQLSIVRSKA
jgi:hypothetical protein